MKVTVITATTGNPLLFGNMRSVQGQSYNDIQHLVVVDGEEHRKKVEPIINAFSNRMNVDVVYLPYATGKDRYNGHRIYGAATFLARGDYFIFLDDDNWLQPSHISDCVNALPSVDKMGDATAWSYSLRNIRDKEGNLLCQDNCESLGKWPSVLNKDDYFVDVNCYFLPKKIAINIAPVWYCKFREPGEPEIDRKMMHLLRMHYNNFACTHKYTVNYTVGNTALSVTPEFFEKGNAEMLRRYNGVLPWVK